jgi:hypothetical protein
MREWQKVPSTCNGHALDSKEGEPAEAMEKARQSSSTQDQILRKSRLPLMVIKC